VVQRFIDDKTAVWKTGPSWRRTRRVLIETLEAPGPVVFSLDDLGRVLRKKRMSLFSSLLTAGAASDMTAGVPTGETSKLPDKNPTPNPSPQVQEPLRPVIQWTCIQKALAGELCAGVFTIPPEDAPSVPGGIIRFAAAPIRTAEGGTVVGALLLGFPLDKELTFDLKRMTGCSVAFSLEQKYWRRPGKLTGIPPSKKPLPLWRGRPKLGFRKTGQPSPFPVLVSRG